MNINRLDECIEWSKQKLEVNVDNRKLAVQQFVGMHYSENGAEKRVPTNFLELAVTIYVRLLATRSPRCIVKTDVSSLTPFAANLEEVVNRIPGEIGLDRTMRRAALEALFSMAVVKVGIGSTNESADIGDVPFVSIIQMDDYFVDMSARSWEEVQYEGNDYWMSRDQVKAMYGVDLQAEDDNGVDPQTGVEQAHSVSVNETAKAYSERVLLRDVYLVSEGRLVTYSVQTKKVLRDVAWDGPDGTPYIKLWFSEVPGNLMPLAPIAVWQDLHELGNALFRKLARQADAKKRIVAFSGGNDEDIARFRDAGDGDGIRFNGEKPEVMEAGGVDNGNLAYFLQLKDLFNIFAGNLDAIGGLSPQADTAAQEKLISEASTARVQEMIDRMVDFSKEIFRRLAWYAWTDPVRERTVTKTASREYRLSVDVPWTPDTRQGRFIDYNFDIDVFSMQDDSPATRLQKLFTVFERLVMPMLAELEKQGAVIDMKRVMEYVGKNSNLPELSTFVTFMDRPAESAAPAGDPNPAYVSTKAPVTRRVYERVNRPGATRQGRDAALMQTLLGGNAQPAEMAALSAGRSMT